MSEPLRGPHRPCRLRLPRFVGTALALGLLLCVFLPAAAHADECRSTVGAPAAHSAEEITARLSFIRQSLRDTAVRERRFVLGWSLNYVGLAAGTWVLYPLSSNPEGQRIASAWNSATSLAAALLVLIDPLQVIRDKNRMEALLATPNPAQSECALLIKAEQLLKHAANNEASARGARSHIISTLTTVGLGVVLAYALKQPDSAVTSTPIGIFLGELMLASRPIVAVRRLQSYRSGDLSMPAVPPFNLSLGVAPLAVDSGYGAAVTGAF